MTEKLPAPSPLDLRTRLHQLVINDLLGPAGGEDEIVDEASVRSRYIVGMLAPKGQSAMPDEQDELADNGGDDDPQDGKAEAAPTPLPAMLPSSLGMTFTVSGEVDAIQVTARWGQYRRVRSETLKTAAGEPKLVWQRQQIEGTFLLPLKAGKTEPRSPSTDFPEVYVRGLIRCYDDAWSVTLFLVNAQTEPKQTKDTAWVFQPELSVRAGDGSPVFLKRPLKVKLEHEEPETEAMRMTYRRQVEFAVGHGVGVHAEKLPGQWARAVEIRTSIVPSYEVEQVDAPRPGEIPALDTVQLDMRALAQLHGDAFSTTLEPLADAYAAWITEQEARLSPPAPDLEAYLQSARSSLEACRVALERMRDGIRLLAADETAAEAFRFANRAMAEQRVRTLYTREVRQKGEGQVNLEDFDIPRNRSWRPFQLAFFLLNIPALLDPTHPDRVNPTHAKADLLWFPTGGGKTEAYLGVAAFTLALRRLQGEVGGYSGHAGVGVLMRYTLRLLTLQQFQRATALMCACEIIRREDEARWGAEPFRIGLWVGQRSTPNWTDDSADIVSQHHGMYSGIGSRGTPLQITNCPWCGKPITMNNLKVERYGDGRGRTFQYCSDPFGQCAFSERQSPTKACPSWWWMKKSTAGCPPW